MPLRIFLAVFLLIELGCAALAIDREQQLRDLIVGHRKAAAEAPSGGEPLGTAFNEIGVAEFECAALAFLLDKDEIYERLGKIDVDASEAETSSADGFGGLLHENWALAADHALNLSQRDRIERWNLNCVGQHGIGRENYLASLSPAADFIVTDDQIRVLGSISDGFFARFEDALMRNPQVKTVALGSGGGSVRDALLAGVLIRKRGLDTTLYADCSSACTLVFLGGVNRTVWSPYPRLGFHQVSREGQAVARSDMIYSRIQKYVELMGAKSGTVLDFMYRATPHDMFYPEVWDLCEPGITTWVQRGC